MAKRGVLRGSKFNNNHQTYVPGVAPLLNVLKKADTVKKVNIGIVVSVSVGARRCKIKSIDGNVMKITFRDVKATQELIVIATDINELIKIVEQFIKDNDLSPTK